MVSKKEKEKRYSAAYGFKKPPYENEEPQRKVFLEAFYLDRFEVTNIEYQKFLHVTKSKPPDGWEDQDIQRWAMYPVVNVSWFEAERYCKWRGTRLPSEAEWEKAARGPDGRRFPWGDVYDENRANTQQKGLAPIGFFQRDASPYGVLDMGGNVAEWVKDWYKPYSGNTAADPDFGETYRVVRGGSWGGVGHYNLSYYARTAYRGFADPAKGYTNVGFRCAVSAEVE